MVGERVVCVTEDFSCGTSTAQSSSRSSCQREPDRLENRAVRESPTNRLTKCAFGKPIIAEKTGRIKPPLWIATTCRSGRDLTMSHMAFSWINHFGPRQLLSRALSSSPYALSYPGTHISTITSSQELHRMHIRNICMTDPPTLLTTIPTNYSIHVIFSF